MTENKYLKMPWSVEDTIENLKEIRDMMIERALAVNLHGKAESDAREVAFDFDRAIKALEEIQQYRALGTVEELAEIQNSYFVLSQEVRQYEKIGTVKELREAMEKQRAKKSKTILRHRGGFEIEHCPNCDTDYQVDRRYTVNDDYCPTCGKLLDSGFKKFCGNCGQAIDWKATITRII